MSHSSTLVLLALALPLSMTLACEDPGEFGDAPEGVADGELPSLRCEPAWACSGGGQTPNSGSHVFNNVPYGNNYWGADNFKFEYETGASAIHFNGGTCLYDGVPRTMHSWIVQPNTGEIYAELRFPKATAPFYTSHWLKGDHIVDDECIWNLQVYDYDTATVVPTRMRFTDRQIEVVNGQNANTYVMWTDVEPDADGAAYSDGWYTACFDDNDYRILALGGQTKNGSRGISTFTASPDDAVFECVNRSPIGEAFDHMGMHLNDMNDSNKLMTVQNMMQGAGDRGEPTTDFNTYIAPVCDSGEHTTAPPSTTHELEACWDRTGATCHGVDYRIEAQAFPTSYTSKPACTPALVEEAYCCSYVLRP